MTVADRADFETKLRVARALADGDSMRQAANAAGVNVSTVSRWALAHEPEFEAARMAVAEFDAAHPVESPLPDVHAGVRGDAWTQAVSSNAQINEMIRAAAGR